VLTEQLQPEPASALAAPSGPCGSGYRPEAVATPDFLDHAPLQQGLLLSTSDALSTADGQKLRKLWPESRAADWWRRRTTGPRCAGAFSQ